MSTGAGELLSGEVSEAGVAARDHESASILAGQY